MSSLSRCTAAQEMPRVLPAMTLFKIVVVITVLLAFGLAHLSLRFQLGKIQRETNQLQALQSTLASEVKALKGRTEAFKQSKHLFEYARLELGMVPYRPDTDKKVLVVPGKVHKHYELARAESLAERRAPAAGGAGTEPWFDKFSDRLGLISQAVAGEKK